MNVRLGDGKTDFGPGVLIEMDGGELALAVHAWLTAHGVHIEGPRTVTVNGEFCHCASVYVDPSGFVVYDGGKIINGRGNTEKSHE
jgi:hypothetical protein